MGLGMILTPMTMAAFSTLPPEMRLHGSSLLALLMNLGGSVGISGMFTTIARNIQVSHSDLSGHITAQSLPGVEVLNDPLFRDLGAVALYALDAEINRQAAMIAYIDVFYAMGFVVLLIMLLPIALKPIHLRRVG